MGQIIGSAAKPKRCNLNKLSQLGTPAAGEYILVSSDNSMNAAGQGNFDAYVVGNGRTAATALELKSIDGVAELAEEVDGINKELDVFVEKTKNMFNPSDFSSYQGISVADGVVSGTALAFHTSFGGVKYYPLYTGAFKENTQYTFSCETRTDNEAEATGNGLQLRMVYMDGTVEVKAHSPNTQTDWAVLKGTSAANKTLAGIGFSYSASAGKNHTTAKEA